jgi:hypothetical protein
VIPSFFSEDSLRATRGQGRQVIAPDAGAPAAAIEQSRVRHMAYLQFPGPAVVKSSTKFC